MHEARRAADSAALPVPAAGELSTVRCWTGGSAVHPDDPLLRRAAWAVVWWTGAAWAARSGPPPGEQTVARAELAWAGDAVAGPLEIVTGYLSVVHGAAAMACGGAPHRASRRLVVLFRALCGSGAYRDAPDPSVGFGPMGWLGNLIADGVASRAARAAGPPQWLAARPRHVCGYRAIRRCRCPLLAFRGVRPTAAPPLADDAPAALPAPIVSGAPGRPSRRNPRSARCVLAVAQGRV